MTDTNPNAHLFVTPVRLLWPHLIDPRPARTLPNGTTVKSRYEASLMIPIASEDLKAVKAIMARLAKEKFGRVEGVKFPLQSGDKMADENPKYDRSYLRGHAVLQARALLTDSKDNPLNPPRLVVLSEVSGAPNYIEYEGEHRKVASKFFYSGVTARAEVSFSTYEPPLGPGVTCYINHVLSLNIGEHIAGGMDNDTRWGNPADEFKKHIGVVSAENPVDDEIPF